MVEIICQECNDIEYMEQAVKVSGEGFVCAMCVEKLYFRTNDD